MHKNIKRLSIRKRDRRLLLNWISKALNINAEEMFGSKPKMEIIEMEDEKIYLLNDKPLLASLGDVIFPTLLFKEYVDCLPKVIVDMGAVPHICNGADVMAPGIIDINGEFKEKALVAVIDERNRRPIAIAQALVDSEDAKDARKGKVFKNLHYVGDEIWNMIRTMLR